MTDIAPSLVEAAARVMCANAGIPDTSGTHWQQFAGGAEAVLAAVGDALRLEGAQAERERIVAVIAPRLERARGMDTGDLYLDLLVSALGGVHPNE